MADLHAFVTGASGFVGSHLAELLLEQGCRVTLLVRSPAKLLPQLRERCTIVQGDLEQLPPELPAALATVTEVYHVAGLIGALTQAQFDAVNAEGSTRLLRAVADHAPLLKRALLVSSLAAYGPADALGRPRVEDDAPAPVTMYGRSKLKGEEQAWELARSAGLPLTVIRPPAVYGPRDPAIFEFFKYMARGIEVGLGGGERSFDLIHVRDLVRGMVDAARSPLALGRAYYLSDEGRHPLPEVMRILREVMKPKRKLRLISPVVVVKLLARVNDLLQRFRGKPIYPNTDKLAELLPRAWHACSSRARQDFGFSCAISTRDGLAETARWYEDAGWLRVRR